MIFETQFADNCLVLCIHAGCCSHMVPCSRPQENLKRKREKREKNEIFFCFGMGCESMVSHPAFLLVCFTVFTELTSIFFASVLCFAFLCFFTEVTSIFCVCVCVCVCALDGSQQSLCSFCSSVLCPSGRLLLFFVFVFSCLINPAGFCV